MKSLGNLDKAKALQCSQLAAPWLNTLVDGRTRCPLG